MQPAIKIMPRSGLDEVLCIAEDSGCMEKEAGLKKHGAVMRASKRKSGTNSLVPHF